MKFIYAVVLAFTLPVVNIPSSFASTPEAPEAKTAKAKRTARCVERKLDVKTGMMITRYGCEKPPQGAGVMSARHWARRLLHNVDFPLFHLTPFA